VSLEGQYAKHFPTQVWESINMNKQELEMLSNSWIWGSKVRTEKKNPFKLFRISSTSTLRLPTRSWTG
jgi:hypothetical protein